MYMSFFINRKNITEKRRKKGTNCLCVDLNHQSLELKY